jgi:hypothetical protein
MHAMFLQTFLYSAALPLHPDYAKDALNANPTALPFLLCAETAMSFAFLQTLHQAGHLTKFLQAPLFLQWAVQLEIPLGAILETKPLQLLSFQSFA